MDADTETLIPTIGGGFDVIALAGNIIGRKPENGGNGDGYSDSGESYTLTKTDLHAVACFKGGQGAKAGGIGYDEYVSPTLSAAESGSNRAPTLLQATQVRRLTPTECARLQGFPDDYLPQVPGYSDSAAYKALGNSMAVNVMQLIGQRIQMVHEIPKAQEIAA